MSETVWYTFSTEGEPLHPTMPEDHEPWYKGEVVIKGAVPPPTGNEQRWIVTVYGKSGNATKWDGVPVPFHAVDPAYAQFMGEVNTIAVEKASARTVRATADGSTFQVPGMPAGFETGFLIIRPEVMKIGKAAEKLKNKVKGVVFNDYALGSRIQYQVRSDARDEHWLVERLQDDPYEGHVDDKVTIGWQPADSILVSE